MLHAQQKYIYFSELPNCNYILTYFHQEVSLSIRPTQFMILVAVTPLVSILNLSISTFVERGSWRRIARWETPQPKTHRHGAMQSDFLVNQGIKSSFIIYCLHFVFQLCKCNQTLQKKCSKGCLYVQCIFVLSILAPLFNLELSNFGI